MVPWRQDLRRCATGEAGLVATPGPRSLTDDDGQSYAGQHLQPERSVPRRSAKRHPASTLDQPALCPSSPESVTDRVAAGTPGPDRCRHSGPLCGPIGLSEPASTASQRHSAPSSASCRVPSSTNWLASRRWGSPSPCMARCSGSPLPHRVQYLGSVRALSGPRSLLRLGTLEAGHAGAGYAAEGRLASHSSTT